VRSVRWEDRLFNPARLARAAGTAKGIERRCVMPPAGVSGGSSLAVGSAPPSFPFPRDSIFFRFLHFARSSNNTSRKATPATLPTTLPTTTDVDGAEDPEPELAAASVLEGDALDGATPVAPPTGPPPTAVVAPADDENVELRKPAEEEDDEVEEGLDEEVEDPDEDEESEVRYVSEDLEDEVEVVVLENETDELLELRINGAINVLV
jgi:hypothetical protein